MKTVKHVIKQIVKLLTHTFIGLFPNDMKTTKVIPVFKSGDHLQCSNYRPVSVTPIF